MHLLSVPRPPAACLSTPDPLTSTDSTRGCDEVDAYLDHVGECRRCVLDADVEERASR